MLLCQAAIRHYNRDAFDPESVRAFKYVMPFSRASRNARYPLRITCISSDLRQPKLRHTLPEERIPNLQRLTNTHTANGLRSSQLELEVPVKESIGVGHVRAIRPRANCPFEVLAECWAVFVDLS